MTPGLSGNELAMFGKIFAAHPEIEAVTLFGSRAKGTHKPHSDVDLALRGGVTPMLAQAVARELDELPTPYRFDVLAFDALTLEALREHILRVGVPVYSRDPMKIGA